jgi:hypothetical protein
MRQLLVTKVYRNYQFIQLLYSAALNEDLKVLAGRHHPMADGHS